MAHPRMMVAMLAFGVFASIDGAHSQPRSDLTNVHCLTFIQSSIAGTYDVEGQSLNADGNLAPFRQVIRIEAPSEGTLSYFDGNTLVGTWRLESDTYSFVSYGPQGQATHRPFRVSFDCRRSEGQNRTVLVEEWRTPAEAATNRVWEFRQRRTFTAGVMAGAITMQEVGSVTPPVLTNTYVATLRVRPEPPRTQQ